MALFKVEISGVNTTQLPLLTNEEKTELFKEIKKGNKEARERYIQGESCDLCLVLYRDFLEAVRKILTICFRLAVSVL